MVMESFFPKKSGARVNPAWTGNQTQFDDLVTAAVAAVEYERANATVAEVEQGVSLIGASLKYQAQRISVVRRDAKKRQCSFSLEILRLQLTTRFQQCFRKFSCAPLF